MKLTKNHLILFRMIQDRGIGRCCNDLNPEEEAMLTPEEWKEFCINYHYWNGDHGVLEEMTSYHMKDFMVVAYIQHLLIAAYEGGLDLEDEE